MFWPGVNEAYKMDFQLDSGAQRLLFILSLPLLDGVFPTLLVTGAVETFSDIVVVALTIFTGAGALAILYSNAETTKEAKNMVKQVTPYLITAAIIVALIAPSFEKIFHIGTLEIAAGLALISISMQLMNVNIAEKFSVPGIMITGMILSIQNPTAITIGTDYLITGILTASLAITALYFAAYLNPEHLIIDRIRRGGAIVITLIAATLFGYKIPSLAILTVFILTVLISINASIHLKNFQKLKVLISTLLS